MTTKLGILALAVSVALAGCASDNVAMHDSSYKSTDTTGYTAMPDHPQVAANDKTRGLSELSDADRTFINGAEAGNMFEISAAQKALLKSNDPQIKTIAQHISDDHQKANNELINLASRKGMSTTAGMTGDQLAMLSRLDNVNGADFDREYVNQQQTAHQDTISTFENAAANANDKDLRDWASATLPALRNHLTMLQNESKALNNNGSTPVTPNNPSGTVHNGMSE